MKAILKKKNTSLARSHRDTGTSCHWVRYFWGGEEERQTRSQMTFKPKQHGFWTTSTELFPEHQKLRCDAALGWSRQGSPFGTTSSSPFHLNDVDPLRTSSLELSMEQSNRSGSEFSLNIQQTVLNVPFPFMQKRRQLLREARSISWKRATFVCWRHSL